MKLAKLVIHEMLPRPGIAQWSCRDREREAAKEELAVQDNSGQACVSTTSNNKGHFEGGQALAAFGAGRGSTHNAVARTWIPGQDRPAQLLLIPSPQSSSGLSAATRQVQALARLLVCCSLLCAPRGWEVSSLSDSYSNSCSMQIFN